ncbi:MAG: alpha/beta hydrolase [Bacillota bacterium]|nr:alpha/beta hydrolase [Bacillota bacterium]
MKVDIIRDGFRLAGEYEYIANPIVIMSHGFMGDMGYKETSNYPILQALLNNKGFSTIRFDYNGHGKSDGAQENMTVLNEILDLFAVIRFVKEKGHKRIFLLGHSQGGVVSSMVAGYFKDQIEALVLMAPAAALKDDAINGTCMGIKYDPYNVPAFVNLHDMFKLGGEYIRTAQTLPIFEVAGLYEGPVCLIHGKSDEVVNYKYSEKYHEVYKNSELHLVEGEDHNIKIHREDCFQIVLDFLSKCI